MGIRRPALLLGLGLTALALVASTAADAQSYATRTVRLIVGFGAGGPTDIPARFIADKLGTILKQRVIVENKPGAAGMLATRDAISQPADGHTLLLCTHFEVDQHRGLPQSAVQADRPRADLADLEILLRHRDDQRAAGQRSRRLHRPCQGQSGCHQLRDAGRRLGAGDFRPPARTAGRHLAEPRPVPHRPADHAGPHRRARAHLCLANARRAAAALHARSSR